MVDVDLTKRTTPAPWSIVPPKEPSNAPPIPSRLRNFLHTLPFIPTLYLPLVTLFFLSLLHISSLTLFTRGFLLNRSALTDINDCSPTRPNSQFPDLSEVNPSCTLPPTHQKLVLLVVDALRADFVLPSTSNNSATSFQHNFITLPSKLNEANPTHSFLAHFIADAPTTTLQRLKGLTTGSLPTFVDAGSNFAASGERVDEDNWLSQAKRNGKRLKFVGDDTWLGVFPTTSAEEGVWKNKKDTKPFDSFNVEDLETVDSGVKKHLLEWLGDDEQEEWDIVIAHSLGLDHAGHRFGALHSELTRKLKETNDLLEEVVEKLKEDTLLVVIGDHGMTERGDHGGDTREEVDAALWVYSKGEPLTSTKWFTNPLSSPSHPISPLINLSNSASELGDKLLLDWPQKGLDKTARSVSQVDLVPTLSLLLGLPIPFGSLGLPIPDLFFRPSSLPTAIPPPTNPKIPKRSLFGTTPTPSPPKPTPLSPLQTLLHSHLLVASQISHYLTTYTSASQGSDLKPFLPELHFLLQLAQSTYKGSHAPGANSAGMEHQALEKFWKYSRKVRERARSVWARFDQKLIIGGLVIWFGSVVVGGILWNAAGKGRGTRGLVGKGVEGAVMAVWLGLGAWLLGAFERVGGVKVNWVVGIVAAAMIGGVFVGGWTTSPSTSIPTQTSTSTPTLLQWKNLRPLLPLLAHCSLFASNSFTIFEDRSLLFILSTLLVLAFLKSFSAPENRLRKRLGYFSLAALVLVRLMSASTICREEQIPNCHPTFYSDPNSWKALIVLVMAGGVAWSLPEVVKKFLEISKSDKGLAPIYLGFIVRGFLVIGTSYWAVDLLIARGGLGVQGEAIAKVLKTALARIVLVGTITTGTVVWSSVPLCLAIEKEVGENGGKAKVSFTGFANSFGSTYLLFFSTVFALLWLVANPLAQVVLAGQFGVILCLLEIFDSERDVDHLRKSITQATIEDFLNNDLPPSPTTHMGPTFYQLSILAILSHVTFFATGHQATLSSIQWSTAFIGFPTLLYPISPLLVILNTLSPFILSALSIPLFVFWNVSPALRDQPPLFIIRSLIKATVGYSTYQAMVGLSAAVWAAYFRRHLMVWKVFAPRFMMSGIVVLGTDVTLVVLAVGWGAVVTIGKVKKLFGTQFAE